MVKFTRLPIQISYSLPLKENKEMNCHVMNPVFSGVCVSVCEWMVIGMAVENVGVKRACR